MVKQKITIEQLGQEVVEEIRRMIPQAEVDVREVRKNNNLLLHGITIRDSQESTGITPTIYLDNYYKEYCNDELTAEEIAEKIIELHLEERGKVSVDVSELTDFNKAKKNLRIKLINTERNKEFLETIPHKEFLDMAMVYQIKAIVEEKSVGTTVVTDSLLKLYGVSVDELHEAALENMKATEPADIAGMTSKLFGLASTMGVDPEIELEELAERLEDEWMLIISNKSSIFGASQIVYEETLQKVASIFQQSYFILPSSIHECLAIRALGECDVEGLKAMVKEINSTQVLPEEVLSDNVYFYNAETGELSIA